MRKFLEVPPESMVPVPSPVVVRFVAGDEGEWIVDRIQPVSGPTLEPAPRLAVLEGGGEPPPGAAWVLRGVVSDERYTTRVEHEALARGQPPLGRPSATRAALIPVLKSPAWWALPQDERRAILEDSSHHIATGLEYLPAVARRLHHGRDLGEPFDFLTWFEFSPADAGAFEELIRRLRRTEEWSYVIREVDIRLTRRG